jgi:acetyl-CoA carboxylase biotin carboxyl carrier protein
MSQQAASVKKVTAKKGIDNPKLSEPSLNMDELRELAALVNENGFTDFEFENANIRVRLSKNPAPQYIQAMPSMASSTAAAPLQAVQSNAAANKSEAVSEETSAADDLHTITSPIVGTFYRSPSPDKEPYVKEGSNVSPDSIVCIVEAMKLMNEIEAEISGEVVKIYVEDGQPVEFGQPLFGIKK